ncbi:MAG TPA: SMI1/KNR4 family protein [Gammaproteobacteria bacterium]|nr:SMI1/KNR4 family protein [Gammaproteobacteria bacterium]
MSAKYIDEAISKIDASGAERPFLQSKLRVDQSQIIDAEKVVGFSFPESFRYFLYSYGSGDFKGIEFYGLVPGNNDLEEIPNSLWLTMKHRRKQNLPDDLYIVENLGDGSLACLLLSQRVKDECPVILWDYSEGRKGRPHVLAGSFGEYFYQRIIEVL